MPYALKRRYMPTIWCVEDDPSINELYSCVLESYGYGCAIFESGKGLFEALEKETPDLILLDIMLPEEDGFQILSEIKSRAALKNVAVIFVSAKGDELSKVRGLNLGADDYVSKPFGVLELMARINANLRSRTREAKSAKYKDIEIDEEKHSVSIAGRPAELTKKEYKLLQFLVRNAGKTVERGEIFFGRLGRGLYGRDPDSRYAY